MIAQLATFPVAEQAVLMRPSPGAKALRFPNAKQIDTPTMKSKLGITKSAICMTADACMCVTTRQFRKSRWS